MSQNQPAVLRANIKSIVRLRVNSDGEGVRTVVFLYGCPLKCRWCCNPETRTGGGYHALTPGELLGILCRDLIYFQESGGGVTFSGGEPLLHHSFIREFARLADGLFSVNVETSLYGPAAAVEALIPWVQHWFVDFKAPTEQAHVAFTGVSRQPVLDNLRLLSGSIPSGRITMAFPLIPGYTATEECAEALIRTMSELGLTAAQLHPHRKNSEVKYTRLGLEAGDIPALPPEQYAGIRSALESAGIRCSPAIPCVERRKCDVLKQIRREINARHNLGVDIPDCSFRGRCPGTCPKCEEELDRINFLLRQNGLFPILPESSIPE